MPFLNDNNVNANIEKERDIDVEIEKEFEKDTQFSHQKQFNKQLNYNWFDQKVIVKQYQGQKALNDADSDADVYSLAKSNADAKAKNY